MSTTGLDLTAITNLLGEAIYRDQARDGWVTESGLRFSQAEVALARRSPVEFIKMVRGALDKRDEEQMKKKTAKFSDETIEQLRLGADKIAKSTERWADIQRSQEAFWRAEQARVRPTRDVWQEEVGRREMERKRQELEWFESQRIIAPAGSDLRGVLAELSDLRREFAAARLMMQRVAEEQVLTRSVVEELLAQLRKGVIIPGSYSTPGKKRKYSQD